MLPQQSGTWGAGTMQLSSVAFAYGTAIPLDFTSHGSGGFPPFTFENALPGTQSLALVMHTLDKDQSNLIHWLIWNIDPSINELRSTNALPTDVRQGTNDFNTQGYYAPDPQYGVQRYAFDLAALNIRLDHVPEGANYKTLRRAMQRHVISRTQLIGTVSA